MTEEKSNPSTLYTIVLRITEFNASQKLTNSPFNEKITYPGSRQPE
jgi:hypothetical protein